MSVTEDLEQWTADVIAADGGMIHIRPMTGDDGAALRAFVDQLSDEAIYQRFFSPHRPDDDQIERFVDLDQHRRVALVAELDGTIIAVGRYMLDDGSDTAEIAFVVDDEQQGRGIGTILLEHLAVIARANGITRFHASTLYGNRQMLRVFRHAGYEVGRSLQDGVWDLDFVLDDRADVPIGDRDQAATARSVGRLLAPRVVAVVGASREPGSVGHALFTNLLEGGFTGTLHPINPHAASVAGVRAYPSVAEIPDPVDLAVIAVPAAHVATVLEDCGRAGALGAVVITAGFAESGPAGAEAEAELLTIARRHGMRLVGPNCIGVVNADPAVGLDATFSPVDPPTGRLGFASQSGALGIALIDQARRLGLGVSTFVSLGNKVDISGNDLLQYWETDPATSVGVLYLESFGNPRKFSRLARRFSRVKPLVVVKSGRTEAGRRGAASHTAALASDDALADALFEQAGIIRVDTLAELFTVCHLLAAQPLPAGRRVAIVGNSGGPGILAADACHGLGLEVPELADETQTALRALLPAGAGVSNPVDLVASANAATYERALRLVLADDAVDAAIVIYTDPMVSDAGDVASAIARAVATGPGKPLAANFLAADVGPTIALADAEGCVPVFAFPEAAAVAIARAATLGEWRRQPTGEVVHPAGIDLDRAREVTRAALDRGDSWLDADDLAALLAAVGINLVTSITVDSAEAAAEAQRRLDRPVALKVVSDSILHKSDVGGVVLDLPDDRAVADAYRSMADRLGSDMSGALVQPMAVPGVETIVGVVDDPSFGPAVMFGLGGTTAELWADRAFRLVPLTDVDAGDLLDAPRGSALLTGYRGTAPVDRAALLDLLARVSALADGVDELAELDLNPVIASPTGLSVVDARARVAPATRGRHLVPVRRLPPIRRST